MFNYLLLFFLFFGGSAISQTYTIGTGTTTSSASGVTPFTTLYEDGRVQYLYLASHLTAAGMTAGNYDRFAFNFTALGGPFPSNVNLKMGLTSTVTTLTALNTSVPMTTVFSSASPLTITTGWNTWALSSAFAWDGTSNILVEVCFDDNSWSGNYTVQTTQFASGVSNTYGLFDDGVAGCAMTTSPNSPPSAAQRRHRPNAQFTKVAVTPPNCATGLSPADVATGVYRNPVLTWTAATGSPSSYDVYFGTSPTPALASNVTGTSYTPTAPLLANTVYYWQVVPKNVNGPATGCSVQSFTTSADLLYCTPTTTFGCTDGDVIARVILNTLDNNSGTGCPSGTAGYSNYTTNGALTTTLQAGSTYGCTVYAGQYPEGYAAWIDYNDDGVFDNSTERIGFSVGQVAGSGVVGQLGSSATFPITLSCNPPLGQHRLRVRAMYNTNGSAVTPCANNSYGEVEDYVITITAPDPCPAPSGLASANATSTSADLSWNPGCVETNWEVFIQQQGLGAPTGSGTPVTSSTYPVSGLTAGPAYEFYVRANCLGNGFSSWAGPYVFTTPPCSTLLTPADDTTNVSLAPGYAEITWASAASATSYNVYFGTTSGSLTNIGSISGNLAQITGLVYNTTYFWSIAPVNAQGETLGCAEFSFTTEAAPADDLCETATSLDALTSPVSGATTGLADNYSPSCNSTSTGDIGPDKFYSITVPANYTLVIGLTASNYDSVHSGFYGSCASQTELFCSDTEIVDHTWTNNTGSTQTVYWVQDSWYTGSGTFTLAWTLTPPPVAITGFTPASVCGEAGGTEFTITGSNFTGASEVYFNGIGAPSFTVNNDNSITVTAPAGDIAGPITVYAQPSSNGSTSSSNNVIVYPLPVVDAITGGDATLCEGDTVDLENASPGGTWSSDDESVATVDAEGLVSAVSAGDATISYSVTDNGCTTAVTTSIHVNAPVVSSNPSPQTVTTGNDAAFSVSATGAEGYQWQVSVDGGDTFDNLPEAAPYSGTFTNTLLITGTPDTLNGNLYRVIVLAADPCPDYESTAAVLNVGDIGILIHPQNVAQCSTSLSDAVFTVVASGTVNSYSWEEDQGLGFNPLSDATVSGITYSGTGTDQLTVSGLTLANSGYAYRVVVVGPANSATSNAASYTVNQGVSITTNPSSTSVCYSGGTASFTSAASGSVAGYMWQYSTNNVSFNNVVNGTPTGVTYTGASTTTLNVTTTAGTPTGGTYFYRMVADGTGVCADASSTGAQLMFNTPAITSPPSASSVSNGTSTTFTVATSAPSPSYQWQYSTSSSGPWTNVANGTPAAFTYTGATTATLNVAAGAAATSSSARWYRAIVTSAGCSVNSTGAQLTVTAYCNPAPGSQDNNGITNVTIGTINNTTGSEAGYYGNYAGMSTNIQQLTTVPFSIQYSTGYTYDTTIWIDWNNSATFTSDEIVYQGTSLADNPTTLSGSINVPLTAPVGPHRMRIGGVDSGPLTNPCYTGSWGTFEDYTVNVLAAPACSGTPAGGTATSSVAAVCVSGTATLTATGYTTGVTGVSIQWYNTVSGAIPGATNPTYTTPVLSAPASYFLRVTCANGGAFADSNTVSIGVNNPSVTGFVPGSRCGTGTVNLSATGSAGTSVIWYEAASGGAPLYTGENFTTPSISSTTTYYVEANAGGSSGYAGPSGNATSTNGTNVGSHGVSLTTTIPNVTINSIRVPFTGTGTITFALKDTGNTTVLASYVSGTVTGSGLTPIVVPVNINIANAGNYILVVNAVSGTVNNLGYGTGSFPYTALSGAFSITSGYWYANDPSMLYIFGVNVSTGCPSARTAVEATVNTPPAFALSGGTATICDGSSTTTPVTVTTGAADYDTYSWSPSTGVTGNAGSGWTFNPTTTTSYVLTASNSVSGCANTAAFAVTVNPLPQNFSVASATMCSTDAPVQLSMSFGASAPTTGCTLVTFSSPYPGTTFSSETCDGSSVNSIATNCYTGEYSNVDVSALTKYVFSSSGPGDLVTITSEDGATVLAAGPSPVTYVNVEAGTIRFYSQEVACAAGQAVNRTRSFVCSPVSGGVWSPTTGLFTDAAGTVPYTGTVALSVYAKPSSTTGYTATATTQEGCPRSASATVTVNIATTWYVDADGDNYGDSALPTVLACAQPSGYAALAGDCNDAVAAINPGHAEVAFNGVDDNCNGTIDEGSQLFSQVLASQCGTTLTSISSLIGAVSFGAPVDGYRFRVVNTTTNAVQTIDRTVPNFSMTMLASYDYATTYSISVMLRRNGIWLNYYGNACLVSTPAVLDPGGAAAVTPSQCGIVLPS
ncbi:Ig-like domain-containing protein, partial [Flavobacterium sp. MAH-1]